MNLEVWHIFIISVLYLGLLFVIANARLTHYARWVEFLGGTVADVGWVMGLGAGLALVARPWIGQFINVFSKGPGSGMA